MEVKGGQVKVSQGHYWPFVHVIPDKNHEVILEENSKREIIVSVRLKTRKTRSLAT